MKIDAGPFFGAHDAKTYGVILEGGADMLLLGF